MVFENDHYLGTVLLYWPLPGNSVAILAESDSPSYSTVVMRAPREVNNWRDRGREMSQFIRSNTVISI